MPKADAGDLVVVRATEEHWSDVAELLGGDGDHGCWCEAWRGRDQIAKATGETRPDTVRRRISEDGPAPGFLAYRDQVAMGWAGVGVRPLIPRLVRSRTIPAVDDRPVWVSGCFRVKP